MIREQTDDLVFGCKVATLRKLITAMEKEITLTRSISASLKVRLKEEIDRLVRLYGQI